MSASGQSIEFTEKPFGTNGGLAQQISVELFENVTPVQITSKDLSIR